MENRETLAEISNDNNEIAPVSARVRPSPAQMRYLKAGMSQPGGKLPLFDDKGQQISAKTIRSCIEKGWAEPWFNNPVKPDWLVCRLTDTGKSTITGG